MEYHQEDFNVEEFLPIDLVDENYAEEDDLNDGVPMRKLDESCGEETGAEDGHAPVKDFSLNHEYIKHLTELRRAIVVELKKCKEKKEIILRRIKDLEKQPMNPMSRKNWYNLFGYPYFKDKCFFPCPINDDQRTKLAKREIDYHKLQPIRRWSESDCLKLEQAVKANALEKKLSGLVRQRGLILDNLKNTKPTRMNKIELNNQLSIIESEIDKVKNLDPVILYGDKNTQFDWLKITAEEFGECRSSEEVQAMWLLCRHPLINRKHWTRTENALLQDIAKRHKEQDWASIAEELNTNRSEFQCIIQYQRKVNTDFINHRWTDEEDEILKFLVERCRVNDYVPWATIAMCMKNRTRQQVYNRWNFCVNPLIKKGRFAVEEDCLILAGVKHFGPDYSRIAELLPGRTAAQVNARYKMCLSRNGPRGQWSVEEDMRLLKLVEIHGKKWHWLTIEHFRTRSRSQIRHRYIYLEEWLSKNPDCSVSKAPRRDLGDTRRRNSNLWSTIQNALAASNKNRKKTEEIDRDDIELLKVTMTSDKKVKRTTGMGRKKKVFTKADRLLHQLGKVCYTLSAGRIKALFTEEEFLRRESMVLRILNALQSQLAFPFDESLIKNDSAWNQSDQNILLGLKEKYDQRNSVIDPHKRSKCTEINATECYGEGSCAYHSVNRVARRCAGVSPPLTVPLYGSQENVSAYFPEIFPGFIGNVIGFRTVLLSRLNLRMWKSVPANEVVALPAVRPTSQALQVRGMKCFSKEESAKLFSERLFSLFFWPTLLVRVQPELDDSTFGQPTSSAQKTTPDSPPPKKGKKRTMQHQARSKRLLMKKRWEKFHEEKNKKVSETGPSSRTAGNSKKKRARLELL